VFNNCQDSKAKVEKVVKPPRKPVIHNERCDSDNSCRFIKNAIRNPIRKEPSRLTNKVPIGIVLANRLAPSDSRYLNTVPSEPPMARATIVVKPLGT